MMRVASHWKAITIKSLIAVACAPLLYVIVFCFGASGCTVAIVGVGIAEQATPPIPIETPVTRIFGFAHRREELVETSLVGGAQAEA